MDFDNSPSLYTILAEHFREQCIEVFDCRHCNDEVKTSDSSHCNALLCKQCFDARDKYRIDHPFGGKNNPEDYDEKAENSIIGDKYGEKREEVSVVCACCENIYELVPEDYVDVTPEHIEFAKKHYDDTFPFHEGKKPFRVPKILDYKHAPKGWANNILCKNCLDEFLLDQNTVGWRGPGDQPPE